MAASGPAGPPAAGGSIKVLGPRGLERLVRAASSRWSWADELALLAARRPALYPLARRWPDLVAQAAREHTDDPLAVSAVSAAADGLCTQVLLDPLPVDAIRAVLLHAARR
ncbi:MAG: hypothetical protein AB7V44_11665 [Pseudonocardia sp.]